jgi:retron-type reverse transcriptase
VGSFDNLDHEMVLDILAKDIKDTRFLKLIRTMLKAGYMEDWKYHETLSGTPQGGVASPILANIVLNELDKFVENELLPKYNREERRKKTPEFLRTYSSIKRAKQKGDRQKVKELTKELRKMPSRDPDDPHYRRLRYNRYADDMILGFAGPKEEANLIKEEIKRFLQTLKLEMSEEKTLITHALTDNARYLGYDITVNKDDTRLANRDKNRKRNTTQRSINYHISLRVPTDKKKEWIRKYVKNQKPAHRTELIQMSDFEIVQTYGQELRGIVNYYSLASNVAEAFYPVKTVAIQSAAATLARKHKTRKTKIYRKYKRKSEYGMTALIVEVPNPNNTDKPLRAQLGEKPIKVNRDAIINDKIYKPHYSRNELTRRLLANECELCQSSEKINVHHIKKLADMKKRYKGKPNPPLWVKFMMERHRKTIVVCSQCHQSIHAGKYDGKKVE